MVSYGLGSLANKDDKEKVLELNGQMVDNRLIMVDVIPEPEFDKLEGRKSCDHLVV